MRRSRGAGDFSRDSGALSRRTFSRRDGVASTCGAPRFCISFDSPDARRHPLFVQDAVQRMHDHGIYGYYGDDTSYRAAICWWMQTRHNWQVDPDAIFTTHGLVNGTAMCVETYTQPGDGVVLMTPVYHAFAKVIRANGRRLLNACPVGVAL